jgi:hypothetical protein
VLHQSYNLPAAENNVIGKKKAGFGNKGSRLERDFSKQLFHQI